MKAKIMLPYGRTKIDAEVDEKRLVGVFEAATPRAVEDPDAEVERALDSPIGSKPLEALAEGKRNAVVIISDHTRPVPSRYIIPHILKRLRKGNPDIDITLLVATGCHRGTRIDELREKLSDEIVAHEKIVVHDCQDDASMADLGVLPSGGRLLVNKLAPDAELLVSEGFIEPHFFAGFSGGRKSVLPGIASRTTVLANHCAKFIADKHSRTGILDGNPIHRDMVFAAKRAGLAFIVNVIIDRDKRIVKAFTGAERAAHEAGCEFLSGICRIEAPESDIVLTSNGGYPLDQNIYQAVKGMTAAEAICRKGGVIVISAACNDGHGGESFYHMLSGASSPQALIGQFLKRTNTETESDQWEAQILARILSEHHVVVVTHDCDHALLSNMGLIPASTLDEAIELATKLAGADSKIAVIPDGVSVVVEKC